MHKFRRQLAQDLSPYILGAAISAGRTPWRGGNQIVVGEGSATAAPAPWAPPDIGVERLGENAKASQGLLSGNPVGFDTRIGCWPWCILTASELGGARPEIWDEWSANIKTEIRAVECQLVRRNAPIIASTAGWWPSAVHRPSGRRQSSPVWHAGNRPSPPGRWPCGPWLQAGHP